MTKPNPRMLFKLSAETIAVAKLFEAARVGDVVTYEDMRKQLVGDVTHERLRSAAASAVRMHLRDNGAVFSAVPNVGYRRLSDVEIVESSDGDAIAIRRKAERSMVKLAKANPETLNVEQQGRMSARLTCFAAASGLFGGGQRKLSLPEQGGQNDSGELKLRDSLRRLIGGP